MNDKEILEALKSSGHNKVRVAITDVDGVLRGKLMHVDKLASSLKQGFGFCNVVFGWDVEDQDYRLTFSKQHGGYPDAIVKLDPQSYRTIPWENKLPMILGDFQQEETKEAPPCPRSLLKQVNSRAKEMGYAPIYAQEFEWFNFNETPESWAEKQYRDPDPATPGMFGYSVLRASYGSEYMQDLFDQLEAFDIPLEGLHTETGPGVYEAAIKYDDIVTAADKATLFKTAVKEIAYRHGLMASFMAKYRKDLPGCSGHIHQSLWDVEKKNNLFYDGKDSHGMSEVMKQFLAGQLACLPAILPMYAPTVNSYKRLVEGAWAPTSDSWGNDNRTTAFRVIAGNAKSIRIENRVAGADVNPYLAMAASLASGLYGIANQLMLKDALEGNAYEQTTANLPKNLRDATSAMKQSELARNLLGESFVRHFVETREWEWSQFESAVTDWEMKRYFEII